MLRGLRLKNSLLRNNRIVLAEEENVSRIQKLYFAYKKRKKIERERIENTKANFFEHFNPPAIEIIEQKYNKTRSKYCRETMESLKKKKKENTSKMMKNILEIKENYESEFPILPTSIVKINK